MNRPLVLSVIERLLPMTLIALFYLVLTGAVAGIMVGFLGVGGGAILTPLCLMAFPKSGYDGNELIRVVFGTNMFLVAILSVSAAVKHHSNKKIDWRLVASMSPLAVIGSFAGAWLATVVDPGVLKKMFASILVISSLLLIIRGSEKPSVVSLKRELLPRRLLPFLGFFAGLLGGFLGIGGGIVMIPALILIFAYPVDRVAATSSSIIIFIGISGMISYMLHGGDTLALPGWSTGYVWWSAALPLALGGIPTARLGAVLNAKTHDTIMQRIFGAVLFLTAVKIFFS